MKKCNRCGEDISHHTHKATVYCQKSDRDGICYDERRSSMALKTSHKRAAKRRELCQCGNLILTEGATKCRACSDKRIAVGSDEVFYLSGNLEWPYTLPNDPSVTPSMINPL